MDNTDAVQKWINLPHITKLELYIGFCDDEPPYAPNYTTTAHTVAYSLQYIPSGKGKFTINGKVYPAKAGDLFAIFPDEDLIERADSNEPWHFIFFQFTGASAHTLISNAGLNENNRILRGCQSTRIPSLMKELVQAAHDINNPFRLSLMSSKCFDVFHEIAHVNSTRKVNYKPPSLRSNYAQRIAYYLSSNYYDKNLSVDSLSRVIGLNRSYLYKIFKEATGMSPQAYLMQTRINKAREFLLVPESDVTSVASAVGYELNSFSRAFKNITGFSPLEYKKKNIVEK